MDVHGLSLTKKFQEEEGLWGKAAPSATDGGKSTPVKRIKYRRPESRQPAGDGNLGQEEKKEREIKEQRGEAVDENERLLVN